MQDVPEAIQTRRVNALPILCLSARPKALSCVTAEGTMLIFLWGESHEARASSLRLLPF
jgi:hypothetical protein